MFSYCLVLFILYMFEESYIILSCFRVCHSCADEIYPGPYAQNANKRVGTAIHWINGLGLSDYYGLGFGLGHIPVVL